MKIFSLRTILVSIIAFSCNNQSDNKKIHPDTFKIEASKWYVGLYISRIDTIGEKKLPVILMSIREDFTGVSYFNKQVSYSKPVNWEIPSGEFNWSIDPGWDEPGNDKSITCVWPNGEEVQLGYLQKTEYVDPFESTMLWMPQVYPQDGKVYMKPIGYRVTDDYMKELQRSK